MSNNETTLNDYIPLLKPIQQEYIVWCVQKYDNRPDFHRGMLPFLKAQTAANCLKFHLEVLENSIMSDPEFKSPIGRKFIRALLGVFENALLRKLCNDETSVVMYLKTTKLTREFGRRFHKRFCVTISGMTPNSMAELEMLGKDRWRVTASKRLIDKTTTWLADQFR